MAILRWLLISAALGLMSGYVTASCIVHAQMRSMLISGHVTASEQEKSEGYFNVGPGMMIAVKPDTDLHRWFLQQVDRDIDVLLDTK
jgi:hypothetical protein